MNNHITGKIKQHRRQSSIEQKQISSRFSSQQSLSLIILSQEISNAYAHTRSQTIIQREAQRAQGHQNLIRSQRNLPQPSRHHSRTRKTESFQTNLQTHRPRLTVDFAQRRQLREGIRREWKAEVCKTLSPEDNGKQHHSNQDATHHRGKSSTKKSPFRKRTDAENQQIVEQDINNVSCQNEPHRQTCVSDAIGELSRSGENHHKPQRHPQRGIIRLHQREQI